MFFFISELEREEMSYVQIYGQKIVTPSDLLYFKSRTSVNDILGLIHKDILDAPLFEWFPQVYLSPEQLQRVQLL